MDDPELGTNPILYDSVDTCLENRHVCTNPLDLWSPRTLKSKEELEGEWLTGNNKVS